MVCPTMSGWMVERRDQVRTTFLSFAWFNTSILTIRCPSIKGPFFVDRAIQKPRYLPARYLLFALTAHDERIGPLIVAGLVGACRLSPGGHRMTSAGSLSLAAAMRVIHRVHRNAAVA